jgi:hypothetical protein
MVATPEGYMPVKTRAATTHGNNATVFINGRHQRQRLLFNGTCANNNSIKKSPSSQRTNYPAATFVNKLSQRSQR